MKNVILFGGEGYIGKVVSEYLLQNNYNVNSYDNFIYENQPYDPFTKIKLIYEDIADRKKIISSLDSIDTAVILAGLVGEPITKKYPEYSNKINNYAIKSIIDCCFEKRIRRVIFISTCSNYGLIPDNIKASENHPLNPISDYAKSKVDIEKYIMSLKHLNHFTSATILRFATAFGYSPRMRFDLTVNQFVKEMYLKNEITVYDINTWRPYCHVKDFARLILQIIKTSSDKINFEIFNAGSDNNNYTKKMIAEFVLSYFPKGKIIYLQNDVDPRNYKVNFKKLKETLNFLPKYNLDFGIREIIKKMNNNEFNFLNDYNYGNFILRKDLFTNKINE